MEKRILRICLAKELPDILERNANYLYLLYDKLILFFGQNQYYDPFVICESMPDSPIVGCLYILFDGNVKALIGDDIVDIAEIEDSSQLDYLKSLGTTYFIKADKRYLDLQYRTLQLPYHNGTYSMTVSLAKDLKVNDKTVVRYDASKERFYIEGEYDGLPDLGKYKGKETDTVSTKVNQHCIHADLKISKKLDNILRLENDGLYASIDDSLTDEEYVKLLEEYELFKKRTEGIMNDINGEISSIEGGLGEDTILRIIYDSLENYYSHIDELLSYYKTLPGKLKKIEEDSKGYTDKVFEEKSNELKERIDAYCVDSWETF